MKEFQARRFIIGANDHFVRDFRLAVAVAVASDYVRTDYLQSTVICGSNGAFFPVSMKSAFSKDRVPHLAYSTASVTAHHGSINYTTLPQ